MKRNTKATIIAIVAIAIVAALFATGVIEWRDAKRTAKRAVYRTKHEVDKAMNPKVRGTKDLGAAEQCRMNLRLIEGAKRRVAEQKGLTGGFYVSWEDVYAELQKQGHPPKIVCPAGGHYELMPIGTNCRCSIGANNTVETADDHVYHQ